MDTSNKNMPTNKPSMKIGGNIADHSGIIPHNMAKAPVTSASPKADSAKTRMDKYTPSEGNMKARAAVNKQSSQTSDWSFHG